LGPPSSNWWAEPTLHTSLPVRFHDDVIVVNLALVRRDARLAVQAWAALGVGELIAELDGPLLGLGRARGPHLAADVCARRRLLHAELQAIPRVGLPRERRGGVRRGAGLAFLGQCARPA